MEKRNSVVGNLKTVVSVRKEEKEEAK